jgi:hypothetical protein
MILGGIVFLMSEVPLGRDARARVTAEDEDMRGVPSEVCCFDNRGVGASGYPHVETQASYARTSPHRDDVGAIAIMSSRGGVSWTSWPGSSYPPSPRIGPD